MDILSFLGKKNQGEDSQIFLLMGEDRYQLWLAENELLARKFATQGGAEVIRFEKTPVYEELSVALASPGFFSTQTIGIIEDNQWFSGEKKSEERKKEETRINDFLDSLPEESTVIIKTPKADKRSGLYKKISARGIVLEGELLKGQNLRSFVRKIAEEKYLKIDPKALSWLLEQWDLLDGVSAGLVSQELEKMTIYSQGQRIHLEDAISLLSELPEISSFKLIDAWGSGDSEKTLRLLQDLLKNGEIPLKLLGLLAWQIRHLWQVKSLEGRSKDQIASALGVRPFQVDRLVEVTRKLTPKQTEDLMLEAAEADLALKSGVQPLAALEKLLLIGFRK